MTAESAPTLIDLAARIAAALERLAPPAPPAPDFAAARLQHYDAAVGGFRPAPDYGLALDLLIGIDEQKRQFVQNLRRFAGGLPSNHALLWGSRGAGKSSLVKAAFMALANTEAPGLRLVEIDRDAIAHLPDLFAKLRGRPERFMVFCDDLSFEEGASAAKTLKSALEGGVSGPPDNVLFVATSNRRHLMPRGHDESKGLLALAEEAEETISASDRFGLWIGFPPMDQPAYLAAVAGYAERFGLQTPGLEMKALQWAQGRGGRSGRVAFQFVRDLAGELGKPLPI
ncbi:MAG TPA: ATP-binding protein [Caulobacteraceae bacterium]|jgi:predicted AAA+ superfamily ATPase|nr:ATP-binding protein [Caulobacteraceae bacterium]